MKKLLQQRLESADLKYPKLNPKLKLFLKIVSVSCILVVCLLVLITGFYWNRFTPQTTITGIDYSNQSTSQTLSDLETRTNNFLSDTHLEIYVAGEDSQASPSTPMVETVSWQDLDLVFDLEKTLIQAIDSNRNNFFSNLFKVIAQNNNASFRFDLVYQYNSVPLEETLDKLSSVHLETGQAPKVAIVSENPLSYEVFAGEDGFVFDKFELAETLDGQIKLLSTSPIQLQTTSLTHQLGPSEIDQIEIRISKLQEKTLNIEVELEAETRDFSLGSAQLVQMLDPRGGFSESQILAFLTEVAEEIEQEPESAVFEMEGDQLVEFNPGQVGLELPLSTNQRLLISTLHRLENEDVEEGVVLVTQQKQPPTRLADTNDLGIHELIGRGESFYRGSIPGRAHNVVHTANLINGTIVPPGEEFSFNRTVGSINQSTGFQQAYIIKDGRTVLGDGGGVCQGSTTVFRAALDAGLEFTQWRHHSYRVGFYEQSSQPGFDATVYAPSVDLRFRNDTQHHILVVASANRQTQHLVVDIYGTRDGRQVEISNYRQWNVRPAPEPLYQDDPSLPQGTVRQVDWAATGMSTSFDYLVTRGDEELHNRAFTSHFRPWQAVYLVGTRVD